MQLPDIVPHLLLKYIIMATIDIGCELCFPYQINVILHIVILNEVQIYIQKIYYIVKYSSHYWDYSNEQRFKIIVSVLLKWETMSMTMVMMDDTRCSRGCSRGLGVVGMTSVGGYINQRSGSKKVRHSGRRLLMSWGFLTVGVF